MNILMFVNWGLEAKKWQLLVKGIQQISFIRSFRAIFSGQAFALNTINGVGEYLGRIVYLKDGNRLRGLTISVVGSLSQIIITFIMGLFGLLYLRFFMLNNKQSFNGLSVFWLDALIWGLLLGTTVIIIIYFSLSWVTKMVEKIPFISKYAFYIQKVEELHSRELTRILGLSFIRYLVFVAQYLLLLQVFKVNANWFSLSMLLCIMFFILAIIPSITFAELGLRGELSIQLIGLVSTNTIGILFTATGIWLINKVIPALAGSLFILGVRLFKK
ncbi:MAG TPA: lysylphosphatidylglycerol synthase domain-containing protein [Chitinophagaceae bacterium]|nr:lysylphosphatidylglycerol synthase domain-containing protein [Chitinophagaceae bacterium]